MLNLFLQAIVLGLAIAAPVGPVGVICINNTASHGVLPGLAAGIGASIAIALYAAIIGLGLASMTNFLLKIAPILKYGGGGFLLYLGTTFLLKKPSYDTKQSTHKNTIKKTLVSSFVLTFASPMTMLTFLGVMTALELEASNKTEATALILGALLGSILWWIALVCTIFYTAKRLNENILNYINRGSGIIIIGFAIYILGWT